MQGGRTFGTLLPDLSGSESTLSYPPAFVKQFFRLSDIFRGAAHTSRMEKKSEEILAELYRNSLLAMQSIENILPAAGEDELKEELLREHGEYEQLCARASALACDKHILLKEPGPFKKAMMWGSIKLNTLKDGSRAHIAEMMTQGTVMGITSLKSTLADTSAEMDPEIRALLSDTLAREERFERIWKAMICA